LPKFAFSNFQPFEITYKGIIFPTAEHFYQALKSTDQADWGRIAALPTPKEAKQEGRKLDIRPDWETKKIDVMRIALELKFAPGTPYHELLMATGDLEITEWNNWHDRYWGKCRCHIHQGSGENHLGRLLMEIRTKYQTTGAT